MSIVADGRRYRQVKARRVQGYHPNRMVANVADVPTASADMSVVVLSLGAPHTLAAAVASLCAQVPRPEVIVVNSDGGDVAGQLRRARLEVTVIEHAQRLMPGGARNVGIGAAGRRYVAFLADDCLAEAGWVEARLAAHARGAAAVASALVCDRPDHPVALASHVSLFLHRLPATDPAHALRYGASYDRALFERYGQFREDLRTGEDTEFHQRLAPDDRPAWAPDVRTVHRSPTSIAGFLQDQYGRGRRAADAWQAIAGRTRRDVARASLARVWMIWSQAPRLIERRHVASLALAFPLIAAGAVSYGLGAMRGAAMRQRSARGRGRLQSGP